MLQEPCWYTSYFCGSCRQKVWQRHKMSCVCWTTCETAPGTLNILLCPAVPNLWDMGCSIVCSPSCCALPGHMLCSTTVPIAIQYVMLKPSRNAPLARFLQFRISDHSCCSGILTAQPALLRDLLDCVKSFAVFRHITAVPSQAYGCHLLPCSMISFPFSEKSIAADRKLYLVCDRLRRLLHTQVVIMDATCMLSPAVTGMLH
jgi:hypothetical protein